MSKSNRPGVITCKAAVCWANGERITVEEIQVQPPKSSEIRAKVLFASFCHTDILAYRGSPTALYPRVLGHEGVGVVESVGDEVESIKEGDLVIPGFIGECRECENCKSGKTNLCFTHPVTYANGVMPDGTSRISVNGQKLYHIFSCATLSEYMVIDINYAIKIDPHLNLVHASFLSCGYSTGFGAAWKEAKVHQGSTVAVLGLGAVGLGAVEGARILGARTIIGVDKNPKREEKGKSFGLTNFINPGLSEKSISQQIKELTNGLGVDYCIECTGFAPLLNQAFLSTKKGVGQIIVVGAQDEGMVPINTGALLDCGSVKGSIFGGLRIKSDLPFIFDKCIKKELHLDELHTHQISLEKINEAFELMKQSDYVKMVIKIQ